MCADVPLIHIKIKIKPTQQGFDPLQPGGIFLPYLFNEFLNIKIIINNSNK